MSERLRFRCHESTAQADGAFRVTWTFIRDKRNNGMFVDPELASGDLTLRNLSRVGAGVYVPGNDYEITITKI